MDWNQFLSHCACVIYRVKVGNRNTIRLINSYTVHYKITLNLTCPPLRDIFSQLNQMFLYRWSNMLNKIKSHMHSTEAFPLAEKLFLRMKVTQQPVRFLSLCDRLMRKCKWWYCILLDASRVHLLDRLPIKPSQHIINYICFEIWFMS